MNKKTTIAVIVTAVIALALGTQIPRLFPVAPTSDSRQARSNSELPMTIMSLNEATKLYSIRGEYSQFTSVTRSLSAAIANDINIRIAEFKKNATENWKARQDTTPAGQSKEEYPTTPFDFIVTWEPKQLNARTISLIVRIYAYEGGAHGDSELQAYNYDIRTGNPISLASLFPDDPNYLLTISKATYNQLLQDLTTVSNGNVAMDMLRDGTRPTPDNFKYFTFDNHVIDLYFPKYQVAPGAFGEQKVTLSRRAK